MCVPGPLCPDQSSTSIWTPEGNVTCRKGHSASSPKCHSQGLQKGATNTEHEHIPSYISLSVLSQSPQIQQITNASLPLKDLLFYYWLKYRLKILLLLSTGEWFEWSFTIQGLALKGEQGATRETLQHYPREVTGTAYTNRYVSSGCL